MWRMEKLPFYKLLVHSSYPGGLNQHCWPESEEGRRREWMNNTEWYQ